MRNFVLIVFLLLTGCRVPVERNVLLVGDSLLARSVDEISNELLLADDAGYFIMNNAIGGTNFSRENLPVYWLPRAPTIFAEHQVDVVVISLGTNDVFPDADVADQLSASDLQTSAAQMLDAYGGRRIIWIIPHGSVPVAKGAPQSFNRIVGAIRAAAAGRPGVSVVSFDDFLAARGVQIAAVVDSDGVHFNGSGRALFAQMIHQVLMQ